MRRVELHPRRSQRIRITDSVIARAKQEVKGARINPFQLPEVPPGVIPDGVSGIAMDDNAPIANANAWAGQQIIGAAFSGGLAYASAYSEGLAFPGYAFLSELAQRPEYRRMSETLAMEMTRKWIELQSTDDVDKTKEIKELTDALDNFCVRDAFRKCVELDGFFGRSHLYIDTGSTDDRTELKRNLGNGRDGASRTKITKGSIQGFIPVEPVWTYPTNYDSIDPLKKDWYNPKTWFVMGKEVHKSRLLKFVGREVPDLLKPAYSFGGLSMSQMAMPYVNNWLRTRQSVADIIHSFSVFVLKTDLSETLMQGGQELYQRAEFFNLIRDNKGLMMIDKDAEDFQNVSASLGSLDALQAQTQEHMASVSGIPIVKLLGIQPAGLNASSEGELRTFYDWVLAMQEKMIRPNLTIILDFIMLHLWGKVDPQITFSFKPLFALSEKEVAELRKTEAETGKGLVETGIVSPLEERKRLAADPESPYASINVEDVPDLREEEEAGLEPHAGAAKLAEGAGEEQGEIDVPNRGAPGAEPHMGGPDTHGVGENDDEADDSEPYEDGELRPGYIDGENPLEQGAAMRDGQPDHAGRGSPKNRKIAEQALALRERPGYKGELNSDYLEDENPLLGKNPLSGKNPVAGKNRLSESTLLRDRAAQRNAANPDRSEDEPPNNRQTKKDAVGNEDDEIGKFATDGKRKK